MDRSTIRQSPSISLVMRLLRQARPYWPHLAVLLLLSLVATPLALLMPLPLVLVIDGLSGYNPDPSSWRSFLAPPGVTFPTVFLAGAVALLVGLSLLDQLQKLAASGLGSYVGEKLLLAFRAEIFRHVQRLSLSYHDRRGSADSNYRVHWDAGAIQWIAIYGLAPLCTAGLTLVAMICITARIDVQLALVALGVLPVLFLVTFMASRRLRAGWERAKALESNAYGVAQEALTGLRVVKAFGQEDREQGRFVTQSGLGMRARVRLAFLDGVFGVLFGLTLAAGAGLVLFFGGRQVWNGSLRLGDLVLVMSYLAQLYVPVQLISRSVTTMQNALASAQRVFELLDEPTEVAEKADARPLRRAAGAVRFCNVSFAYGSSDVVLRDVSFEVPAGARVGITGVTGAGKTTIVSLLLRFYDPTAGQILLDDVDLRDYRLADLRNQFSLVLQEPLLFSTTVAENIAYARPAATEDEIREAAKAANAHEFIMRLADGYHTLVGERGMRLSGGERQRIALARAFLKQAPILILDEPTSAVDVRTEALMLQAMQRLILGRTVFLISHRSSALADCDMRLEIERSQVFTDSAFVKRA